MLRPGAKCLDVGCGSGLIACAMAWLANGESFNRQQEEKAERDSTSGSKQSNGTASSKNCSGTGSNSSSCQNDSYISTSNANTNDEPPSDQSPWRCLGVDCELAAITFATRVATELCPDILHVNYNSHSSMAQPSVGVVHLSLPETHSKCTLRDEGDGIKEQNHAQPKSEDASSQTAAATAAEIVSSTAVAETRARATTGDKEEPSSHHRPCGLEFAVADGWNSALYEEARFDAIHVGAAGSWVCSCFYEFRFFKML